MSDTNWKRQYQANIEVINIREVFYKRMKNATLKSEYGSDFQSISDIPRNRKKSLKNKKKPALLPCDIHPLRMLDNLPTD